MNYISIYNDISVNEFYTPNFFQKLYSVEYGFIYLIQIVKIFFGDNYRVLFFIIASFNYIASLYGIKHIVKGVIGKERINNNRKIFFYNGIEYLLFNSYIGFLYSAIAMRAGIALAFSFLIVGYFIQRKYNKCFFSLLIAFMFQRTVLILIIALVFYKIIPIFSRKTYIIIWGILGTMLFSKFGGYCINIIIKLFNEILIKFNINGYSGYLQNYENQVGKADIWLWLLAGSFFLYRVEIKKYYRLVNVYFLGILAIDLLYPIRAASRIYDYFIIYFVPILIIEYYFGKKKKRPQIIKKDMVLMAISIINLVIMLRISF